MTPVGLISGTLQRADVPNERRRDSMSSVHMALVLSFTKFKCYLACDIDLSTVPHVLMNGVQHMMMNSVHRLQMNTVHLLHHFPSVHERRSACEWRSV